MTRRDWILGSLTCAPAALAADPWKKKYPEWKREDALAILNRSPWAITGRVEFKLEGKDIEGPRSGGVVGPMEGPPGGNGTVGPPGGAPARAGGGLIQHGPEAMPNFKTLVRWESARPVRLAMGIEDESPNPYRYVVTVAGFPILRADVEASLVPMKRLTRLERAGKDMLFATRADSRDKTGGLTLVFLFDGEAQPITSDDREVQFVTRLGAMNLRVKFNLRDMMFERKLAV